MPYVVCGFAASSPASAREPDWSPDDTHETVAAAIAQARHWLQEFPDGTAEVVELRDDVGAVVFTVTAGGVEPVDPAWPAAALPARRAGSWFGRPPQVFAIGLALAAVGIWMAIAPNVFDSRPSGTVRVAGVALAVFFGVGTAIAAGRWAAARSRTSGR